MQRRSFKNFLLICFLALISLCCTGFACASTPTQAQLTKIENELWGVNYENETDSVRIERIEKQIFGSTTPNTALDNRINKINQSLGLESLEEEKKTLSDLYVPEKAGKGVEYPQIDQLEGALLGSVYKDDDIYSRMERLEKKVFGAKQDGDLSQRTEALKKHARISTGGNQNSSPYFDNSGYDRNDYSYQGEDVKLQLAALENITFGTDFSQEPIPLRLNRLENKIFQRDFSDDEVQTRVSRIQAAATANKTAKYYDNNKFQKFAATGLQAASFILMILAFIL